MKINSKPSQANFGRIFFLNKIKVDFFQLTFQKIKIRKCVNFSEKKEKKDHRNAKLQPKIETFSSNESGRTGET